MRFLRDPRQNELFDFFEQVLSPLAYARLQGSWQHVFRQAILKRMPAGELAEHFSPDMGRPTKELYSMAGLVFIKEFRDWTHEEAADAYMFHADIQYALNLRPEQQSLSTRTLERYLDLFRENELAAGILHDVTSDLVTLLELDVSKQRLDSTHLESNMAVFGRTRLMGVAIKNFLTQLKRHDAPAYAALPETLRQRYEPSRHALFGAWSEDAEKRQQLRQQVAEEMFLLVERFADHVDHKNRSTYKTLCQVFQEQCEVQQGKLTIRQHPGGDILVNPSDADATLDGHKGAGYQVQLSETCSDKNEVQLIVATLPQTACESDGTAFQAVLEQLTEQGLKPETMLADTAYGGDENVQAAAKEGVALISPASGKANPRDTDPQQLTEADFVIDEQANCCTACPAGHTPHRAHYNEYLDQHHIMMLPWTCQACPLLARCPIRPDPMLFEIRINGKKRRLIVRRRLQQTPEFKSRYRLRSGIESTNSLVKRVTGLGRLRVRGRAAVFHAIRLKVAGWNLLRAATSRALLQKLGGKRKKGGSAPSFSLMDEPTVILLGDFTIPCSLHFLRSSLPSVAQASLAA